MRKAIAIDFGLKRTGLAISDESRMFAFGLTTVDSRKLMELLVDLHKKENYDTIALGLPKRLNNEASHITENVHMLGEALQKQFPEMRIVKVDERFTSKMAGEAILTAGASKKQRREKGLVDKVSATIILQSYLDNSEMYNAQ